MEVPLQGPFTDYAVGGHQSRHVPLNASSSKNTFYSNGLDSYLTRPEAWKILLGTCTASPSGAIGMAGPDYPWPEANDEGARPYPMTASQKAVYYRGMVAKRPVNIRNIHHTTGSTRLGNYEKNYQVVQAPGGFSNPRGFVEDPPQLPAVFQTLTGTTQGRTYLGIRRGNTSGALPPGLPGSMSEHLQLIPSYSIGYLTAAANDTVIVSKFSAPGSIETMSPGYCDLRSAEYSVYNTINFRNRSVFKPGQQLSGSVSEVTGAGTPGIRVRDILGLDYGLDSHRRRHMAKFGRDSFVFPIDSNRKTYDLTDNFMGYSETNIYRSSPNLQGWWRLNTNMSPGTGAPAPDSSGKASAGTFPASVNRPDFSGSVGPSRYIQSASCGFDGGATGVALGGAGDWNLIIGDAVVSPKKMTFAMWVYFPGKGDSDYSRLFQFGDVANTDGQVWAYVGNLGKIYFSVGFDTKRGEWVTDIGEISVSAWRHVTITYDANGTNAPVIYVDGEQVPISVYSTWLPAGTYQGIKTDPAIIGNRDGYDRGFKGQISDFAVWNTVLTGEEIKSIYNAAKLPETSGPGATYSQSPSTFKTQRNTKTIMRPVYTHGEVTSYITGAQFDNAYVQHQIPRADRQYAWITQSLAPNSTDLRYYGYAPTSGLAEGLYSSSAEGYVPYFNFVSASQVTGAAPVVGNRALQQPIARINVWTVDPVTGSATGSMEANTVGFTGSTEAYFNTTLLSKLGITYNAYDYLNLLLSRRGATFGYTWQMDRNDYNPVVMKQRRENVISIRNPDPIEYGIRPVSNRARPVYINMDINGLNTTYKMSHNNEKIYFNDAALDDLLGVGQNEPTTVLSQVVALSKTLDAYNLNWLLYSEQVFPALVNAWNSTITSKPTYINRFWRQSRIARNKTGSLLVVTDSWGSVASQSCWPTDESTLWETQTMIPTITDLGSNRNLIASTNCGGELQNVYSQISKGNTGITHLTRMNNVYPAARLYRLQTLSSPRAVVSPSGITISELNGQTSIYGEPIEVYGGATKWQADKQAGIIVKTGPAAGDYTFQASASAPWWDSYTDFNSELKLISRGYSIVSEYRASEHVEEYSVLGTARNRDSATDLLSIPGTSPLIDSSQEDFYTIYTNSDFMSSFRKMKEISGVDGAQIRLVCSASIRFNPYEEFYPAQRMVRLSHEFSRSYGQNIISQMGTGEIITWPNGASLPLVDALFNPGLMFNTIKAGMAVDYPIVTTPAKFYATYYGYTSGASSVGSDTDNWMATPFLTGNAGRNKPNYYGGGAFFDERLPFQTLITPEKYLAGLDLFRLEAHPSAALNVTSSFIGMATDDNYTKMAKNFFGEVANFYLSDGKFTSLESETLTPKQIFKTGSIYGQRIKLYRSTAGSRTYEHELGPLTRSLGDFSKTASPAYSRLGGRNIVSITTPQGD